MSSNAEETGTVIDFTGVPAGYKKIDIIWIGETTMSSNAEETDPGVKAKAAKLAKDADPHADRLLGRIQGSEWSAVLIVLIVLALVGFGLWL